MKKKILLYGFHSLISVGQAAVLSENLKTDGIEIVNVTVEEYGKRIGVVAGFQQEALTEVKSSNEKEELKFRMVIFCGFDQPEMEVILPKLREAGIGRDDIKVMLTPVNVAWSGRALAEEVYKEHQMMRKS